MRCSVVHRWRDGSTLQRILHSLFGVRAIQNLLMLDLVVQNRQVRGLVERLTVQVPDFDNAEPLLRADRDTHDLIRRIRGTSPQGRRRQIALEHLDGILPCDLQTVGSPADIDFILPQGRHITLHNP